MEAWRGHFPLCPFKKGGNGGGGAFSSKVLEQAHFGGAIFPRRIFARMSPNLPEKLFVQLLTAMILPQDHQDLFLVLNAKKDLHVFFCKPWAPFFEVKQRWVPFLPGFSGILPRFSANQNFWRCPCTPASNTTAFHNSIIGNFVVYQD